MLNAGLALAFVMQLVILWQVLTLRARLFPPVPPQEAPIYGVRHNMLDGMAAFLEEVPSAEFERACELMEAERRRRADGGDQYGKQE